MSSASLFSFVEVANQSVNASLALNLVSGTAHIAGGVVCRSVKICGKLALIPVKLTTGAVISVALPTELVSGLGLWGINSLLSSLTDG